MFRVHLTKLRHYSLVLIERADRHRHVLEASCVAACGAVRQVAGAQRAEAVLYLGFVLRSKLLWLWFSVARSLRIS